MNRLAWMTCLLFGCRIPPVDSEPFVNVELTTPNIQEFTLVCDVEKEQWQLDVVASSWTGGGEWWWTNDGSYVESHKVYSRKAANDGRSDELRLRLDIVADWRDAEKNTSTPFLCSADPTGRLLIYDLDGVVVDCHNEGDNAEWLNEDNQLPSCP